MAEKCAGRCGRPVAGDDVLCPACRVLERSRTSPAPIVKFVGGSDGRPWIVSCPKCGGCVGSASSQGLAELIRDRHGLADARA